MKTLLLFIIFTIIAGIGFFLESSSPTTGPANTKKLAPSQTDEKVYGVNMSGGEFGEKSLPGVMKKDYIYPRNNDDFRYFSEKGITVVRLPIRWERVQHEPFGQLQSNDIEEIRKVFAMAEKHNIKIILDLHNFGRYFGKPLEKNDADLLADVWKKLSATLGNHPALFGYELMNEPHDLPGGSKTWAYLSQAVTEEIRKVDKDTPILIPGYDWQKASRWETNNPDFPIKDPAKKVIYTAHVYFDSNESGRYMKSFDEDNRTIDVGIKRSTSFLNWLKKYNHKGMITEFGIPDTDARWESAMDVFLDTLHSDPNIIGAIYWSAGPWWKDYPLSIEPKGESDRPQMRILQKYIEK